MLPMRFCEKVGFFLGTYNANAEGGTSLGGGGGGGPGACRIGSHGRKTPRRRKTAINPSVLQHRFF